MAKSSNDLSSPEHKMKVGISILALVVAWFFVYGPSIGRNMLWLDDWGALLTVVKAEGSYFGSLRDWFPLMTYRPLGGLITPALGWIAFKEMNFIFLVNLFCFLAGVFSLGLALSFFYGRRFLLPFLFLASFPIGAAAVVYSPINLFAFNFTVIITSLIFWRFFNRPFSISSWLVSSVGIFCSFLAYDAFFTILLALMGLTFLSTMGSLRRKVAAVSPALAAILATVVYQKVIVPAIGGGSLSRLKLSALTDLGAYRHDMGLIAREILQLLSICLQSFLNQDLSTYFVLALILLLFGALLFLRDSREAGSCPPLSKRKLFAWSLIGIFLLLPLPYWLSGSEPFVTGYDSRVFGAVWPLLSTLVAALWSRRPKGHLFSMLAVIPIAMLFSGARLLNSEAVAASEIRDRMIEAARATQELSACEVILLDRTSLQSAREFEIETVDRAWDAAGLVAYAIDGKERPAIPFDPSLFGGRFKIKDSNILFDDYWTADPAKQKVCYFKPSSRDLKMIRTLDDLRSLAGADANKL